MEFSIKHGNPESQRSACLVLGVFESGKLSASAARVNDATNQYLTRILNQGDLEKKVGSTLLLQKIDGLAAERVLLVNLGKEETVKPQDFLTSISSVIQRLSQSGAIDAALYLSEIPVEAGDLRWNIRQTILRMTDSLYRVNDLKTKQPKNSRTCKRIDLYIDSKKDAPLAEEALKVAVAMGKGISLAKDLGNLPSNICTPTYLANESKRIAKSYELEITVLDRSDMQKLGMNTLLSVAKGSHEPPKFVVLTYSGASKAQKPTVLVGKGVTFDTGGISLKPGAEMDEMKYDMCGAASVLGTLKAVCLLKLPINLVCVIPATENMPGGAASKPGDIVESMSGKTIEILNTDAEGRLILCDALTYVERLNPECVIDIATLTGACVIALGHTATGLFSNRDDLAAKLLDAGREVGDRAWQLPLWDDYQEQLNSNFADMANIGGRAAGSITAACFLSRFTKKYPWAHLDIAGTAWRSGKDKGATGRPVSLLTQYLVEKSKVPTKPAETKSLKRKKT